MEIIRAESPPEGSPMADSTAATPGFSGGDRPVGHWGWNNFFQLESAIATFVATLSTIRPATFVATEGSPMADSTAATPGFSCGDRPVGHWGWNNFFQLESAIATFVATLSTIRPATFVATLSSQAFDLELDGRTALP